MPEHLFQRRRDYHWRHRGVKGAFAVVLMLVQAHLHGQVIVYEGDVLPEEDGWTRDAYCDPARWVADGWFWQHVQSCEGSPPPGGQRESFRRSLAPFIGEDTFFIEWRMETDGDRSEIGGVAPASLVASGTTGVNYHFTAARDQVRLIRDNFLPIVFVDIDAGLPHACRLELYGDQLYVWYIDLDVVDSGVPEGCFPTSESNVISFRAKSWYLESTTRWDYIRFGVIPEDGSGDYESDEDVDLADFYFVHECIANSGPENDAGPGCRFADMDQDNDLDLHDFAVFQRTFTGGE